MQEKRMAYLDNVRALLMTLVVFQHAVRAYGSQVWWFIDDVKAPLLERLTAVNSSFFMALFFFISFAFMPRSYDRKGFAGFHRDRFLRLFVPMLAYVLLISPVMMFAYFIQSRGYGHISFARYFLDYFLGLGGKPADWSGPSWPDLNFGHLWFVEHLIVYGIAYSVFRLASDRFPRKERACLAFPRAPVFACAAAVLALVTFAVRVRYPLYDWLGLFGFLQSEPAHLPFYVAAFVFGISACGNGWLEAVPDGLSRTCLTVGIIAAAAVALCPPDPKFYGGGTLESLVYCAFESVSCACLVVGIPQFARRRLNRQGSVLASLAKNSYMMYIAHLPIVVALQWLALRFDANPYLKCAAVFAVAFPLAWCASALIRKIPFFAKYA